MRASLVSPADLCVYSRTRYVSAVLVKKSLCIIASSATVQNRSRNRGPELPRDSKLHGRGNEAGKGASVREDDGVDSRVPPRLVPRERNERDTPARYGARNHRVNYAIPTGNLFTEASAESPGRRCAVGTRIFVARRCLPREERRDKARHVEER